MVCTDSTKNPLAALAVPPPASTTSAFQRFLLALYKLVCRTGLLSTGLGRRAFLLAYDRYKSIWDAAHLQALNRLVRPGTTVVDVGANVGFYTRHFAKWVHPGGEVIAIEPETANFSALTRVISRRGLINVRAVQAVAAEAAGTLRLQNNPFHPADHRIAESGAEVNAVTLDQLLSVPNRPPVSLIKIDVQGAEERVLRGAAATLKELRPAIFMEVDESALKSMGSSAQTVLKLLCSYGYEIRRIIDGRASESLALADALHLCHDGTYVDLLFVPVAAEVTRR